MAPLGPPVPTQPPLLGRGVRGGGQQCQAATAPGAAERSYPTPEARGGGQEEQPHIQEAVAARAQEGLEELSHVEGQEGQR